MHEYVCKRVWGRGGLREYEMDRGDFQSHFALRGCQRKKKYTASKAFKYALFSLSYHLQTVGRDISEPHFLTFYHSTRKIVAEFWVFLVSAVAKQPH